jgi:20S proteasome alpha/beta subunit
MTIGLGILCDAGNSIILVADTRASYGSHHNDVCSKLYDLEHDHFCVIAGDVGWSGIIASEFANRMKTLTRDKKGKKKNLLLLERVKQEYQESRLHAFKWIADETLRNTLGITFKDWRTDASLEPSVRNRATAIIERTVPDCASIVGGFDMNDSPVFFSSQFSEALMENASPGYFAIGSGANLAYDYLSHRGQSVHMRLPQSLYHAIEARVFARLDSHVGGQAAIALLSKKNKPIMIHEHPKFKAWVDQRYDKGTTGYLGSDEERNIFAQTFSFQF